jgi:hypothetical protein
LEQYFYIVGGLRYFKKICADSNLHSFLPKISLYAPIVTTSQQGTCLETMSKPPTKITVPSCVTAATIAQLLQSDNKVKVAGVDCDGILRGKVMSKDKFLSSVGKGFSMSSAIFGWDMHDQLYSTDANSTQPGYADFTAIPDLQSFRRIPWEDNIPFFLLHFVTEGTPMFADGRGMLHALSRRLKDSGWKSLAGGTYTFRMVSNLKLII